MSPSPSSSWKTEARLRKSSRSSPFDNAAMSPQLTPWLRRRRIEPCRLSGISDAQPAPQLQLEVTMLAYFAILLAVLSRILPHAFHATAWNFTAVGGSLL